MVLKDTRLPVTLLIRGLYRESLFRVSIRAQTWFSTFLMLQSFKIVLHVVVNPTHKIVPLIFHNCNFAIAMNFTVNI